MRDWKSYKADSDIGGHIGGFAMFIAECLEGTPDGECLIIQRIPARKNPFDLKMYDISGLPNGVSMDDIVEFSKRYGFFVSKKSA